MTLRRIRSGGGLGDSLYLQSIVRHLVGEGEELEVCTNYPELFKFDVKFDVFSRRGIDIVAHYAHRREQKTNQWEDICLKLGIKAELKIDWKAENVFSDKPILFVNGGRPPMDRLDGFGRELVPKEKVFNAILQKLREKYFTIYCGKGERNYLVNVDLDLNNKTTTTELMDIAASASAFYGQVGFIVPLAESFDKPLLAVWAEAGLKSSAPVIKLITPQKIFSKETSRYTLDNDDSFPDF